MVKTTLYLTQELGLALKEESRRSGQPQAELVREALTRYLADRPRPLPRSIGIASDGTLRARDAKAWVRSEWARTSASRAKARRR